MRREAQVDLPVAIEPVRPIKSMVFVAFRSGFGGLKLGCRRASRHKKEPLHRRLVVHDTFGALPVLRRGSGLTGKRAICSKLFA